LDGQGYPPASYPSGSCEWDKLMIILLESLV
jgi:hypothetical protein